jgi:PBS lyase HEAT-like repeat
VTVAAGTLIGILAFWASPQDDKTFLPAIKKFREEYYKVGAKDDDKIAAVNYLAQHRHERIVFELTPLLTEASLPVRMITARMLSQFTQVEAAPKELLNGLKSQANSGKKQSCVRIEILRALGNLRYKPAAAEVAKLVEDREVWVAKAAIDACGRIRAQEGIDPLLKALRRLEGTMGDSEVHPLDDILEGVSRTSLLKPDSNQKRPTERDVLKQPILMALNAITKQNFSASKEWETWWSKNKATFRVPD